MKQGSVLSPSLFFIVINSLIECQRANGHGVCIRGIYASAAVHADNVRTVAGNKLSMITQANEIESFDYGHGLKLNTPKLEIVKIS